MARKIIVPIVLVAGAWFLQGQRAALTEPGTITHPVYGETRLSIGRSLDSLDVVMLTKAADASDCKAQLARIDAVIRGGAFAMCTECTEPRSQCLTELPPRFAALFDNRPSALTYLSLDRGQPLEREQRIIFWGVSVQASDTLCDAVPAFQEKRKGKVSCVRARRG